MAAPSFRRRFGTVIAATVVGLSIGGGAIIHNKLQPPPGGGGSASVFIAQNSAGSGNGSSCGNAEPVTFFNTSANWSSNNTQPIHPGVTVGLCGTINTGVTFQGDGNLGNPITLQFQTGAKISAPVCNACITMSGRSFVTVDGGTDGQITSNANGTLLANHAQSKGIIARPCTNCEVENLQIGPIYTISGGNDPNLCAGGGCTVDEQSQRCIDYSGSNWLIHNNNMHDASWCIYETNPGGDGNNKIYNNTISVVDHGWIMTGTGPYGKLWFNNNSMSNVSPWNACSGCHHDGIHCFQGSGANYDQVYVYNNTFTGAVGSSATGWVFLENNTLALGQACSTGVGNWYFFNNIFSSTDEVPTNPYLGETRGGATAAPYYLYNNTFSGPGVGHFGNNQAACVDVNKDFENNAVGGCSQFNAAGGGVTDFNAYAFGPSSGGNCWPVSGGNCNFALWQATGFDTHSVYSPGGAVGSNVTGVGANLTSLCVGNLVPLCSTRLGVARPSVGAWNAGSD